MPMFSLRSLSTPNFLPIVASVLVCSAVCWAQDGQFDASFADGGRELISVSDGTSDVGQVLHTYSDGRMLVGGSCFGPNQNPGDPPVEKMCLTKLRVDGSYDPTFGPAGVGYVRLDRYPGFPNVATLDDMLVLEDGRIALVGTQSNVSSGLVIVVVSANGTSLDTSVGSGTGILTYTIGTVKNVGARFAEQADGKILVAATATGVNGNDDFGVVRFNAGFTSVDSSFGTGGYQTVAFDLGGPGGDNTDTLTQIALAPDGGIVLVGAGSTVPKGSTAAGYRIALCRLLANGNPDVTFGTNGDGRVTLTGNPVEIAYDMRIDQQGRLVLGGLTSTDGVTSNWYVNRLTRDGATDIGFNGGHPQVFRLRSSHTGPNSAVRLALTADGIFAFGYVPRDSDPDHAYWGLVRLQEDGAFDAHFGGGGTAYSSFAASSYSDDPRDIAVTPFGVLLVGFGQQSQSDKTKFGLARIQYDEIFQNSFE